MSEELDLVYRTIDRQHAEKSAHTRRQLVAGAAATLGGLGLMGLPSVASAANGSTSGNNDPQTILNVAATAEVLATIVNTEGYVRGLGRDAVTQRNIRAAAREELIHYNVLVASGAKALTKKIWIPDAVFASRTGLLKALEVGDQIFINAYLIGTTAFARAGGRTNAKFARFTGEFMGAEAVHRALARQSLGKLGNDRAFMKFSFTRIERAVTLLQRAGFGFGKQGATPGAFYAFNDVRKRTPNPVNVRTRKPR